ncbi:hypothetical protein HK102_000428, partial [Quaeritorhiza haematococci]
TQSAQGTPILTPKGGTPMGSVVGSPVRGRLVKAEKVEGVDTTDTGTTNTTSTGTTASTNTRTSVGSKVEKKRKRTLLCGSVVNEPVVALVVNAVRAL